MPARLSGTKVRTIMTSINITPSILSDRSGLSLSTIDRIINDRASNYSDFTVQKLSAALGCSPFDLFSEQAINSTITETAVTAVAEVVAEAVSSAVTVVVDEVAPHVSPEVVAESIPNMSVCAPPALDISAYFAYIQQSHKDEIEGMKEEYRSHIKDLASERNAWRTTALTLGAFIVCLAIWLVTHHL